MRPSTDAPPWQRRWEPAMDVIKEDIDHSGLEYYDLPTGMTIYQGDRFWHTEERYVFEIETVKTKVLTGPRGTPLSGANGTDHVFFERDWQPPPDPRTPTHWTDTIHHLPAAEFAELVATGVLVAHRGNGRPPLPP